MRAEIRGVERAERSPRLIARVLEIPGILSPPLVAYGSRMHSSGRGRRGSRSKQEEVLVELITLSHDPITNTFSTLFRDQKGNEIQVRGSLTVPGTTTMDEVKRRVLAETKVILTLTGGGL